MTNLNRKYKLLIIFIFICFLQTNSKSQNASNTVNIVNYYTLCLNMPLVDFKFAIAEALCKCLKTPKKRGRPNHNLQNSIEEKRRKGPAAVLPQPDVRKDDTSHIPYWMDSRQRCKVPECKSLTYIACRKCQVGLCLNKDRNCFEVFHTR